MRALGASIAATCLLISCSGGSDSENGDAHDAADAASGEVGDLPEDGSGSDAHMGQDGNELSPDDLREETGEADVHGEIPWVEPDTGDALALVETSGGLLRGSLGDGFRAFRGIPYAAPPVGPLRWRPPEPPASWDGERSATRFGPQCPQLPNMFMDGDWEEDCLTLNVWTPLPVPENAPVMVWFHGGAYYSGNGSVDLYDGQQLARDGVIVVTLNYRLGALGFLSHPALDAEFDGDLPSGNYGTQDQIQALEWVRDEIAAFGGDPENVTAFGQSAGGNSVCLQLTMPRSRGLIDRAIIQSDRCGMAVTHETRLSQGALLAEAVGCAASDDVLTCLRAVDPQTLISALPVRSNVVFGEGVDWAPTVDGDLIPIAPREAFASGDFEHVPIILGTTAEEGVAFLALGSEFTEEQVDSMAVEYFGEDADAVLAAYPIADYPDQAHRIAAIVTDYTFASQARFTLRVLSRQTAQLYQYVFSYPLELFALPEPAAFHSSELPFVFRSGLFPYLELTDTEEELSDRIRGYWTRFAATGDPNGDGAVEWPVFTTETDTHLRLDIEIQAGTGYKSEICDFWDDITEGSGLP